ncbi:MAG: DUF4405 domain-containing protein [Nitrospinae bacterium]|nr:DUF4405 domain-containing protein [Nitrospinota bacterium]
MRRNSLNLIIDVFAFIGFVLLAGTGLIMWIILPPGSGGGHEGQRQKAIHLLWQLDRHEWGEVHFWIACGLMAVLAVHIFLHWKWIVNAFKGKPGEESGYRAAFGLIGLLFLLGILIAPFLSSVEQIPSGSIEKYTQQLINGSMTLEEIEKKTTVPVSVLKKKLGLPENIGNNQKLGRLRRDYGFEMSQVREIIKKHNSSD